MKNLAKSVVVLSVVALGAAFSTSCTQQDDIDPIKSKAQVTEKANVTMDLKTVNDGSSTGKTVNRGSLHAWISEIDITTTSNDFNYAPFMTPFVLTNDAVGTVGAYGTVEGAYNIEGVALGSNNFAVITKTNTPQILSFESTTMTPSDRIALMKVKNPYAIYTAAINNFNIVSGANTLPQTVLSTQHGRAIGVFTINDALKALGVTARVTVAPSINTPVLAPIVCNTTNNASYYMSNANATGGKILSFTVELLNNNGVVYKTLAANMSITASTSTNTIFTISDSGITTNTATDMFTAQPWNNEDGGVTVGN